MINVVAYKTTATYNDTTSTNATTGIYGTASVETDLTAMTSADNLNPVNYKGSTTLWTFNYKDAGAGKTFKKDNVEFDLYVLF